MAVPAVLAGAVEEDDRPRGRAAETRDRRMYRIALAEGEVHVVRGGILRRDAVRVLDELVAERDAVVEPESRRAHLLRRPRDRLLQPRIGVRVCRARRNDLLHGEGERKEYDREDRYGEPDDWDALAISPERCLCPIHE